MPIVQIHILEGRDDNKKRALVKEVTKAIESTLGTPPDKIRIIISEMACENYAVAGVLVKDNR